MDEEDDDDDEEEEGVGLVEDCVSRQKITWAFRFREGECWWVGEKGRD